ncbi:hypothetical protein JR316_0012274 [Psilocybe cubensis]|uniref:F-box domain-containing protein n=2 Tax=Psilocybe cubensis TaxID=181762 RepID=A0A8H7XRC3_PSICU|nr:hypothetical protein JR316_0012274 [Psilocybe cubensis]KAH9475163.1 hypothetical protein JR316_0012274 [Psilocybe cubensis]
MKTSVDAELPNEMILRIFQYLDLQGLITARLVNQRWRGLVPFAEIEEARKTMLDFYMDLSVSPTFHRTREWVKKNRKSFNRETYILKLVAQYPSLPEEYRLWVLEWPEIAVIGGVWPGLARRAYLKEHADGVNIRPGTNWLSYPQVSTMAYADFHNQTIEAIPGILIWSQPDYLTWLIVDERKHLNGKLFHSGITEYRHLLEGSLGENKLQHPYDRLTPSWIAYLRELWKAIEEADKGLNLASAPNKCGVNGTEAATPIPFVIPEVQHLAGIAWKRRNSSETTTWMSGIRATHSFDREE